MSISIHNLTKVYGNQKAIDEITFEAKPGIITAFLGPNGAGKSTTMKILAGFIPPTSGSASICGFDIAYQSLAIRRIIGYLPENNPLYLDLYLKEFLLYTGYIFRLEKKFLKQRIAQVIQETGLESHQHKKLAQLSKGYRQRAGLAAALLHDPQVLILDEPTTGLDPNQIVEIRTLIQRLSKQKTVLLSTHLMQEVEQICQHVVLLNKGKIVLNDTLSALKQKNNASETYIFEVEFSEPTNEDHILSELHAHAEVQMIMKTGNTIMIASRQDIRQIFIRVAAQENWPLLQIKLKEKQVEDIFKAYTTHSNKEV